MDNPSTSQGPPLLRYIVMAVVVVLAGCGAWYAWGYFGTKGSLDALKGAATAGTAPPGQALPSSESSQDYSSVDIATCPNSDFARLPYGVQVDKAARFFKQAFENGAVQKYVSDAAAINGYELKGGVGSGSINDAPQEIANRLTVETNVYRHESNFNLARNLISGVYKPGTSSYAAEMARIGDGGEMTPTTDATFESTPVFIHGSFAGTDANGSPTRAIVTLEMTTGRVFDLVVQEVKSATDPNVAKVVVVSEVGAKDPGGGYQERLNGWAPKN